MTQRIKNLRTGSLNAVNRISAELSLLVAEFYRDRA